VPPILISPFLFFATLLVVVAVSIFAFVKGCLVASRYGNYVAFDYLNFLGPFRWFIAVGFFGLYISGYLLLWTVAQLGCATERPKKLLPWFGVQFCCIAALVLGLVTAAVRDRIGRNVPRPGPPIANQGNVNPPPQTNQPVGGKDGKPKGNATPAEAPKVTGDKALDRLLADLGGKDSPAVQKAAKRLAAMKPDKHRPVVAKKIGEVLLATEVYNRTEVIRALAVWATLEEIPVFVQLLSDKDINTRNEVLRVIGKFRDERTVRPVVGCFVEFTTRYHGEQALKDLGPIAEKEVLALLNNPDKNLWVPAIRILKEIGTEQSIPELQKASTGDITTQYPAKEAIKAIQARGGK
jgi:hypothetical protein